MIFVSSLTEYNEIGEGGEGSNGLRESIAVFKEVIETPALSKSSIVLFLNKVRVFRIDHAHPHIPPCDVFR